MDLIDRALSFLPGTLVLVTVASLHVLLFRRLGESASDSRLRRQLLAILLYLAGTVVLVLSLPLPEALRSQLLATIGLLVSAVITLSSTSLVGNALAGLMLRALRNFHAGDFVEIGSHFGRVSDRGLFHVEIQTEDRDLVTLPNLYLATHPVKVVRRSGTVVGADVSLGYDVAWNRVENVLGEAVRRAGLDEPFVQVKDLGDFAITYRAAGFLAEVRTLITARSRLRAAMLDALHEAGIEIVSPTFMNQRQIAAALRVVPPVELSPPHVTDGLPEDVVFDKADRAQTQEFLSRERVSIERRLGDLRGERDGLEEGRLRAHIDHEIQRLEQRNERLGEILADVSESK